MPKIAKVEIGIRLTVMRIVPNDMTEEHITPEEIERCKAEIMEGFLGVDDDGANAKIESFTFSLMEID